MLRKFILFIIIILPLTAFAQKKADRVILNNLKQHISYLSTDTIRPSSGYEYIESQFRAIGLQPKGDRGSYYQAVVSDEGRRYIPDTKLSINHNELVPDKDFIPLSYSAQIMAKGEPLIAVQEEKLPWIVNINNTLGDSIHRPDFDMAGALYRQAKRAVHDQATAILFYNSAGNTQAPAFDTKNNFTPLPVPVVFINHDAAKKYFRDQTASADIQLKVAFHEKKDTLYNLIGSIDNGAPSTVIIGAYDAGDKAALIELGRLLKSGKHFSKENYLLVAFSNKKDGTSGAHYFLEHSVMGFKQANAICLINMKGTGRVNDKQSVLLVQGINSSPQWKKILDKVKDKNINIKIDSTSDYSYKISFPVLSFLTPEAGSVSAAGAFKVTKYLSDVIREINRLEK